MHWRIDKESYFLNWPTRTIDQLAPLDFFPPKKHLWECVDSFSVDLCKNTDRTICLSVSIYSWVTDWKSKSAIAYLCRCRAKRKWFGFLNSGFISSKALNGLVRLVSKLSDITGTCLALDPRPDILLTLSARSVSLLKRGFRQRL